MKLTWKIVLKGMLRVALIVLGCVLAAGVAYLILIKMLFAMHLKSLE